jgi:hypothetical protein
METLLVQPPNATKVATKWALINLAAVVIFTYSIQLLNLDPNGPLKWVGTVLMIAFLLLTQKEFRDELGGYLTFSQGFSAGFRYAVFAGILAGVFTGLYYGVLSPDAFTKVVAPQQAAMEQKGMSSADIERAMAITLKYGWIFAAFGVAVVYAVIGAIVGLIGAAIFKKEKSPSDIMDELDNSSNIDPTV